MTELEKLEQIADVYDKPVEWVKTCIKENCDSGDVKWEDLSEMNKDSMLDEIFGKNYVIED